MNTEPLPEFKYKNILWICPPNFAGGLQFIAENALKNAKIANAPIRFRAVADWGLRKKGKNSWVIKGEKSNLFESRLKSLSPDFIICNDKAALAHLTGYVSLDLTRGSVYYYQQNALTPKVPVLIIDDIKKTRSTRIGSFIFKQDINKLARWLLSTQRHQPKFKYKVCNSLSDLESLKVAARNSLIISSDIETSGNGKNVKISCMGYTTLSFSGEMFSWVIPFIDLTKPNCCFWETPELEIVAMETMKYVNDCPAIKTMQNGQYDASHVITYHMPYRNYILDTLHLFHSIYLEAPKRLDFITSITQDFYRYWKDEAVESDKEDSKLTKLPSTPMGFKNYWRYNALDCYYTLVDTLFLIQFISHPVLDWAMKNYLKEFKLQMGPALSSSMKGMRWNPQLQAIINSSLVAESEKAFKDLLIMVDDPGFNPKSPAQVKELVYNVLKAKPLPRKKGATGEKILQIIQTQHPLYRRILNQIWAYKKPANNASKYGTLPLLNSRFMYKASAAVTDTGRQSTAKSHFWVGGNAQNIPDSMRVVVEPDPGYLLFDFDYSQSDAYFTAFTTEDEKFIATMMSDKDTHCIHAEHFFKIAYDKLINAKYAKEDWCVHKTTGVRSVTKQAVYGANYNMGGYTLYITMGQEAVIAAGKHLGYENVESWNLQQLVLLCSKLIEAYFEMYQGIPLWLDDEILRVSQNGNLATCYGGLTRLFFADLRTNQDAARELAAFHGQGGTAGNINKFLEDFHYGTYKDHLNPENLHSYDPDFTPIKDSKEIMALFQVHDSVVGQVLISQLHLLKPLKKQMERTCTINGRSFVVPVEGSIGYGWGKRQIDWDEDISLAKIQDHELQWRAGFTKKYAVTNSLTYSNTL